LEIPLLFLLLSAILFYSLAPFFLGTLLNYNLIAEWVNELPPHLSFPEPGKELAVKARLNGSTILVQLRDRSACKLYAYSSPPAWEAPIFGNETPTILMGLLVIAENSLTKECKGANLTITIPIKEELLEKFQVLKLIVNGETAANISLPGTKAKPPTYTLGGSFPFFDRDIRISIKWASLYRGKLFVCLAATHDASGDYVSLIDTPPDDYKTHTTKPSPVHVYKLGEMTIAEIHILALKDILVQPAATCTPIPLAIEVGGAHVLIYVKVYANGELVATKLVVAEKQPTSCESCTPQ
jgi:hypothetical protein